jgi:lipid-A-disaccharide synthase
MAKTRVMMIAGERSGDIYGAALANALRARRNDLEIFGCGGDAMRQAGVETLVDAHQISIAGIVEVLPGLARAYRTFHLLLKETDKRHPALAILIDFPDFNLRMAKRLKRKGVPIVYFVSPQVWAWRKSRLNQLKAAIDKMLCIFDFEEEIYRAAGIPVEYVGHPLVDLAGAKLSREQFFTQAGLDSKLPTIALLPGSRKTEVSRILPRMLDAASRLALSRPVQFVVAAAPTIESSWLHAGVARGYVGRATLRIVNHLTNDALEHSDAAIIASGTATVEAALHERPMVVVYRVSPITWLMGKFMVNVPFYSMVNLLAREAAVPELMQNEFTAANVAARIEELLDRSETRDTMRKKLRAVKARLGAPGAAARAADAVCRFLPASGAS